MTWLGIIAVIALLNWLGHGVGQASSDINNPVSEYNLRKRK